VFPKRGAPKAPASEPTRLRVPRSQLAAELDERISIGRELRGREIRTKTELDKADDGFRTWSEFNTELLRTRFTTNQLADDYQSGWPAFYMDPTLNQELEVLHNRLDHAIRKLTSVKERLSLFEEPQTVMSPAKEPVPVDDGDRVIFVVHGHDDARKEEVARLLDRLGLRPVILHEQANRGQTLIEKFEQHATAAHFAIVLLTPDDVGSQRGGEQRPRARQNVVFELGFFYGTLGRDRVCVLYEESVELPTDIEGIAYVPLRGEWKLMLGRELRAASIDIDLNRIL